MCVVSDLSIRLAPPPPMGLSLSILSAPSILMENYWILFNIFLFLSDSNGERYGFWGFFLFCSQSPIHNDVIIIFFFLVLCFLSTYQ